MNMHPHTLCVSKESLPWAMSLYSLRGDGQDHSHDYRSSFELATSSPILSPWKRLCLDSTSQNLHGFLGTVTDWLARQFISSVDLLFCLTLCSRCWLWHENDCRKLRLLLENKEEQSKRLFIFQAWDVRNDLSSLKSSKVTPSLLKTSI